MPSRVIVLAIILCSATPTRAQTQAEVAHGKAVAEQACAGCHAVDGGQGGSVQGTPAPSFRAIAGQLSTVEKLKDLVTTPPHPMPAIPLGASEINAIVAYIRSLR